MELKKASPSTAVDEDGCEATSYGSNVPTLERVASDVEKCGMMMLRNAEDCHPIKNVRKLAIAMDARSTCAPDLASAMMTLHITSNEKNDRYDY
ncbi:hypothetical protein M8J75_001265 [Diaphorina citri]|nr:hypothetical protein M8J75_001265 [Diaphorina citri]